MKQFRNKASAQYSAALKRFLTAGHRGDLADGTAIGRLVEKAGLKTVDMGQFHEHALVVDILPHYTAGKRAGIIRRAGPFFTAAITPIEKTQRGAKIATTQLKRLIDILSRRTIELASSNVELNLEIEQRKLAELALEQSEAHYAKLLAESNLTQKQLRRLSRKFISAHEDERRKISRELHDVIAQTLTGINLRLATLKRAAASDTKGIAGNISRTQKLVENAVEQVHQFARELRPVVLDDLGLMPALHAYMQNFSERTGIRSRAVLSG